MQNLVRDRQILWQDGCMAKIGLCALAWFLSLAPFGFAQDNGMRPGGATAHPLPRFVKLDTFNVMAVVPSPPPSGSFAAQVDLETVLQAQAWRTPEQVAWA